VAITGRRKFKILLVEDDSEHAEFFQRSLSSSALECEIQYVRQLDGEATLLYLKSLTSSTGSNLPNLIVLDLNIPRIDGFGVLEQIKRDDLLKLTPVIVLSTTSNHNDVRRAYSLGASSFLVKPFDITQARSMLLSSFDYWINWNSYWQDTRSSSHHVSKL
jgi:CheY-like chemotaxis protein